MQAQLFISSIVLLLAGVPSSSAHGADRPDQLAASRPQFSVSISKGYSILRFQGKTAQAIFNHLQEPEVQVFNTHFYQLKIAFGFLCIARPAVAAYDCFERITDDGEVQNFFPYSDSLKNSASWIQLNLHGPALAMLYNKMSDQVGVDENDDGSITVIKQRTALSCSQLIALDGRNTFTCSQLISGAGLPIGPGSDPLIGSGTHPLTIDVEEGHHP